jgi:hypothetical protein
VLDAIGDLRAIVVHGIEEHSAPRRPVRFGAQRIVLERDVDRVVGNQLANEVGLVGSASSLRTVSTTESRIE